jgi:hypothetical protein
MNLYMDRWVRRTGNRVEFGNVVGPYCGNGYTYDFPTPKHAADAAIYLSGRDPENPNMPTEFSPETAKKFGALES